MAKFAVCQLKTTKGKTEKGKGVGCEKVSLI
jgi:hypothetical protein